MANEVEILAQKRKALLLALGKKVQKIREEKGLSQVDLAARMLARFDTSNVSRIESGRTNPTIFNLYRIAEALEIPLRELIDLEA